MTHIQKIIIERVKKHSRNDETFIFYIKELFNIKSQCEILKIDRNRYNYLKRTNQLDTEILKLKKKVSE